MVKGLGFREFEGFGLFAAHSAGVFRVLVAEGLQGRECLGFRV